MKLWWVIRAFGRDGLAARLSYLSDLAEVLRQKIDSTPRWERVGCFPLPPVWLRYAPVADRRRSDELNLRILAKVNSSGSAYLSKATLDDGIALRVSLGNIQTRLPDVLRLWESLESAAREETR